MDKVIFTIDFDYNTEKWGAYPCPPKLYEAALRLGLDMDRFVVVSF